MSHDLTSEPAVAVDALETFVDLLARVEADGVDRRLLQPPVRGDVPRRLDGPRGDLPLRRRPPPRARRGRLRDRPRRVRGRAPDRRVGADRAPGARGGPRDRGPRRRHARGPRRVPRPAARGDARLHAAVGRRPLARRHPVRPRAGQRAATRQRAPGAVGARQDRRARHARAAGDQPAGARAPAAGADRPRARRARGRDPAPVRRPARVLQPGRAVARRRASGSPPSCRPRCSTCGARCSARSAASRRRRTRRCCEEVDRLRREHPDLRSRSRPGPSACEVPRQLEPLAQSVLAEAVRNAHKHARPDARGGDARRHRRHAHRSRSPTTASPAGRSRPAWACGSRRSRRCRSAGIVEFGEREPGTWRVRLAVPVDRA